MVHGFGATLVAVLIITESAHLRDSGTHLNPHACARAHGHGLSTHGTPASSSDELALPADDVKVTTLPIPIAGSASAVMRPSWLRLGKTRSSTTIFSPAQLASLMVARSASSHAECSSLKV